MIGFRLFRSQMPSLLLYALFPRVKQKELTSFTINPPARYSKYSTVQVMRKPLYDRKHIAVINMVSPIPDQT